MEVHKNDGKSGQRGERKGKETYPERAQIRRRVVRSVLSEPAREHVPRPVAETARACALVTHLFYESKVFLLNGVQNVRLVKFSRTFFSIP